MKKKIIVVTLAITVAAVGILTANAYQGGWGGCDQSGRAAFAGCDENQECGKEVGQFGRNRAARGVELFGFSDEQQEQVAAIRAEERTAMQAMRESLRDYDAQMRILTGAGTFDEQAIRTLGEEKAKIQVEMEVVRARMHNRVNEIMTPEQQELALKLRSERFANRGERRGGRGRW